MKKNMFTVFLSVCLAAALFIPKTAFAAGTEGRRLGDVNNDGIVSIRDVTAVQRLTAELETYDSLSEKAADVDVSGDVTISDATCIQHYLADYPTDYPINEPLDPYASQAQAALNALKTRLAQTKAAADGLPVLIRSYDTEKPQLSMAAYTYDNALAAMAFISSGDKDDAETILDAFVYVIEHDRFKPGRIRTAYAADTVYYNNGGDSVKLPGWWDPAANQWSEDPEQIGCDVGNTSYAALAMLQYDAVYDTDKYLSTAKTLMDWVLSECTDEKDGFTAGFTGWPENDGTGTVRKWRSTEHNLDSLAVFRQLYAVTGEQKYQDAAESALRFITSMYDAERGLFYTGTLESGSINRSVIPLDAQVWSAMVLGEDDAPYEAALNIVDSMKLSGGGYPFYTVNANGGWWAEGTAFTALMFRERGEYGKYADAMEALCGIQLDSGLFPAATVDTLLTGLSWEYSKDPHVAPTAWFVMAVNEFDPYVFGRMEKIIG